MHLRLTLFKTKIYTFEHPTPRNQTHLPCLAVPYTLDPKNKTSYCRDTHRLLVPITKAAGE